MEFLDDFLDDECSKFEDEDLETCEECGKLCPSEHMQNANVVFGKQVFVCSECARAIGRSMYSGINE